jgi:hypothetical protein
MTDHSATSCPLCSHPATVFATLNFGRHNAFDCKPCGQVATSDQAYERIKGLSQEFKDHWRSLIRAAKPELILLITVEPAGAGGGLKEEWVQRSSLGPPP